MMKMTLLAGLAAFGERGAIEALFTLVEREEDAIIQANALWALGNLAWNRNNADRIGRSGIVGHIRRLSAYIGAVRTYATHVPPTKVDRPHWSTMDPQPCQISPTWQHGTTILCVCVAFGRYMGEVLRKCRSDWVPIQTNAMVCLANCLYYDDDNRRILEDLPEGVS
jgi:hypothetical protein